MDRLFALLICAALAMLSCAPLPAAAQSIQRCTGSDGVSVFTDRPCSEVAATPRLSAPAAARDSGDAQSGAMFSRQCPQRLSQLVDEIQMAVHSGDINRLSALYWWAGQDNASASRQLERLEAIVERPLLDIAPVYAQHTADPGTAPAPSLPAFTEVHNSVQASAILSADAPPSVVTAAPARPRPVALRLEQNLRNSATPSRSVLRLRRQYGCFWVSF